MSCPGLKQQKPGCIIQSQTLYLGGIKINNSTQLNYHQEDINTGLKVKKKLQITKRIPDKQLSIPESQVPNNLVTSEDKKNTSNKNIQTQSLNQILVQDSIIEEHILKPFFNASSKEISKKLWLPIKTDLQELPLNSLNGSSMNLEPSLKAWKMKNTQKELGMNSLMTSYRLLPSLQHDTTEVESIKKPRIMKKGLSTEEKQALKKIVIIRARKFRLKFLDNRVKDYFNLCFDAYIIFYNLAIKEINKRYYEKKKLFNDSKICIQKECKIKKANDCWFCDEHKDEKPIWNLNINIINFRKALKIDNESLKNNNELKKYINIPYDLRNEAIESAITAYKSACSSLIKGLITSFELKEKEIKAFTSKQFQLPSGFFVMKDDKIEICKHQVINQYDRKKDINTELKFNKRALYRIKNSFLDKDKKPLSNFQIYKDKCNRVYLILTKNVKKEIYKNRKEIISLDPGVRTFQTCYDPSGIIIESGTKIKDNIYDLYGKIKIHDKEISNKNNSSKKRRRHRKMKLRKYQKITNIVDNTHNQLISYLTKNYNSILAPQLPVSELVKKSEVNTSGNVVNRVISATTSRFMNTFSFYKFHEKLKSMASLKGCKLYIVEESYTSKTCGVCGELNNNLGGSKTFKCPKCSVIIDRDYNGARNILLKHLI